MWPITGQAPITQKNLRHDQVRLKRGRVKLHSIVYISTRIVLDYLVTDGYTPDIAGM